MPGSRPSRVECSDGPRPGAWGGYSVRRSGRLAEVAMGSPLCVSDFCWVSAYQAIDRSRPKRMRRPRAMTRRMVHVSVDSWKDGRVPGVDMMESPLEKARCTRKNVLVRLPEFFKEEITRRKD